MKKRLITSESVTEGHPDKICDQISDAILDYTLKQDRDSRVGCDVSVKAVREKGRLMSYVFVGAEITSRAKIEEEALCNVIKSTIKGIGYDDDKKGFNYNNCDISLRITKQSPNIAQGVNSSEGHEQGAGDQGMMFGFACNETPELMPMPILFAHKLTERLAKVRKNGIIPYLGPDGKSQVTVEYEDNIPKRLEAIVIAQQHMREIHEDDLREKILSEVIYPICGKGMIDEDTRFHINATGAFITGGPEADSGETGRKIIVDNYGGGIPVGGGAFSGKDPSKVDRSGAYAARYIAKNIVAAGLADKCLFQLSYAIGVAEPIEINVNCFGTNKIPEEDIKELIFKYFPLKPAGISEQLRLKNTFYLPTASYGHFGRRHTWKDGHELFPWEETDKADMLKELCF